MGLVWMCMIAQEWMGNLVEHFNFATHESDPLLHIFCACFNYICPAVQGIFLQSRGLDTALIWVDSAWSSGPESLYTGTLWSVFSLLYPLFFYSHISGLYNADGVCCDHVGQRCRHSSSGQLMPILYMIVSFVSVWCPCYSKHKFNWSCLFKLDLSLLIKDNTWSGRKLEVTLSNIWFCWRWGWGWASGASWKFSISSAVMLSPNLGPIAYPWHP